VKVRVLGCGTSNGVPRLGSGWGQCDPNQPRNRRLRSSILLSSADRNLLVDCGPDVRAQLLAAEIDRLDGVIVTHDHADHCHGIDDLRPLSVGGKGPLPLHAREHVLAQLGRRFDYIFRSGGLYPAVARPVPLGAQLQVGDALLRFVDQPHGAITSVGMRIDEGDQSLVYAIDFNHLNEEMQALYQGADVLVADCLSRQPHPSHAHLDAVVGWARDLGVGQLYLSHLNNSMDYDTLRGELPDWAQPAWDGLEIELQ
jgi:phosphoribosyl 1,2-cyclic phosphate phosphodiesterase